MMLSKSIREVIAVALVLLLFASIASIAGNEEVVASRALQYIDVVMMSTTRRYSGFASVADGTDAVTISKVHYTDYAEVQANATSIDVQTNATSATSTDAQIAAIAKATVQYVQPTSRTGQQPTTLTKQEADVFVKQALVQCNTYGYATATLVHSIIDQESDYRTNVVSVANAKGIMQLMPETFGEYLALYPDKFKNNDIFDVYNNICAGILYLNDCYKAWESTATSMEDLALLALASYNVGVTGLKTQYKINDANELKKSKEFPSKYAKQVLDRVISK